MRFSQRSLPSVPLTLAAETNIDIPRDYFIQRLMAKVTITYNTGASVSKTGTIFNALKAIKLVREGKRSDIPFSLSGVQIYNLSLYDYLRAPLMTDFVTTASQTGLTAVAYVPIDFRIDKWNDADISALIDAFNYSAMKLSITLDTESSVGSGYTFTAATAVVSLWEVIPEGEKFALMNHTLTQASFGSLAANQAADLKTGGVLRRLVLITSSDTAITQFNIDSGTNKLVPVTDFGSAQQQDEIDYGVAHTTGWVFVDFAEINGLSGSLDLTGAKQGDVKLYITPSGSNAAVTILYDQIEK